MKKLGVIASLLLITQAAFAEWPQTYADKPAQATLYYDQVHSRIGVNTNSPTVDLEVFNTISATNIYSKNFWLTESQRMSTALDDKVSWSDFTAGLATKANTTDLSNYTTTSALGSLLAGKANSAHTHVISDTIGLQTALDGKATIASVSTSLALKSDKAAFLAATGLSQSSVTSTTPNAPNDAPTGLSVLLLLGATIGELNATNVRQNTIANKVNELAYKLNQLISDTNVNVSRTNLIKNAGAGL